jgi:uncharacterized protein YqeY
MDRSLAETRDELQGRLRTAMRAKDVVATSVLRSTLAALANAEAVPVPQDATPGPDESSAHVAGARLGVGAGEAPRAHLTPDDVRAVLGNEHDERVSAAEEMSRLGRQDRAARLRAEADVLVPFMSE